MVLRLAFQAFSCSSMSAFGIETNRSASLRNRSNSGDGCLDDGDSGSMKGSVSEGHDESKGAIECPVTSVVVEIRRYVRDGKFYIINPDTGLEEESPPESFQAWLDGSGNLQPMTAVKLSELRLADQSVLSTGIE